MEVNIDQLVQLGAPRENPDEHQWCSECKNILNCWTKAPSARHVVTNLLICRIKRDIDTNRNVKLLLEMLNPKIAMMANNIRTAIKAPACDLAMITCEVQSAFIEHLMHSWVIGEIGYPLYYLFDMQSAIMKRWMMGYITKIRKQTYDLYPIPGDDQLEDQTVDEAFVEHSPILEWINDTDINTLMTQANDVIGDGYTLRTTEYRVLKFCLDNAKDAKRPLNGLHVYLSKQMGVVRSRCTKLFSDACDRLREEIEDAR